MRVKKYTGKTVQDAIFQVKADMGSDAIILDTRKLKRGGFFGLFQSEFVEVLAGLEDKRSNFADKDTLAEIGNLKKMITDLKYDSINNSFAQHLPEKLLQLFEYLQKQGINNTLCKEIIFALENNKKYSESADVGSILTHYLQNFIGEAAPIEVDSSPKVISFIGPTGVGKTTTIAKIAAEFAINKNKKVGLITTDTYRVAAVQQIETYSKLVDLPLKVIYSADNLRKVIDSEFKYFDLILIDTAGSSWRDQIQLGRIKSFIDKNLIDEVHLLLSVNTKATDLIAAVKHFLRLEPDKVLLTKLDATSTYGDVINLRKEFNLPYSYITYGQDVPEDIGVAEPKILVDYIMGDFYE